jgi:hypothetical protein
MKQRVSILAPLLLMVAICGLKAQTNVGTFVGRVADPSGASVPNAALALRNQRTSFTYRAVTDQRGTYDISLVQPGIYTLTVNAKGFATYEDREIQVTTGEQEHYDT